VQYIVDLVDRLHSKGATVTNRQVRNTLYYEFGINISNSATGMYLKRLGLTWKRVLPMKRDMSDYRKELMRLFLNILRKVTNVRSFSYLPTKVMCIVHIVVHVHILERMMQKCKEQEQNVRG
jgi:hypothetical protein